MTKKTTLYASKRDHSVNGRLFVKNEVVTLVSWILNTECKNLVVFRNREGYQLQMTMDNFIKQFEFDSVV